MLTPKMKNKSYWLSSTLIKTYYHVKVGQRRHHRPKDRAGLNGLDPEVVGELQGKNGDALVIVAACHGSADIPGNDCDKASSE